MSNCIEVFNLFKKGSHKTKTILEKIACDMIGWKGKYVVHVYYFIFGESNVGLLGTWGWATLNFCNTRENFRDTHIMYILLRGGGSVLKI